MRQMKSVERQTRKALADVDMIHSFLHPLGDPDPRQNLYQARSRREDAVRMTVLQMSLAIEDLLDSLFARVFVGHDPLSKKRVRKGKFFRELEEVENRMGFEAKLKLARLLRLITKEQQSKQQSGCLNTRAGISSTSRYSATLCGRIRQSISSCLRNIFLEVFRTTPLTHRHTKLHLPFGNWMPALPLLGKGTLLGNDFARSQRSSEGSLLAASRLILV
jgi:hypothetical protein